MPTTIVQPATPTATTTPRRDKDHETAVQESQADFDLLLANISSINPENQPTTRFDLDVTGQNKSARASRLGTMKNADTASQNGRIALNQDTWSENQRPDRPEPATQPPATSQSRAQGQMKTPSTTIPQDPQQSETSVTPSTQPPAIEQLGQGRQVADRTSSSEIQATSKPNTSEEPAPTSVPVRNTEPQIQPASTVARNASTVTRVAPVQNTQSAIRPAQKGENVAQARPTSEPRATESSKKPTPNPSRADAQRAMYERIARVLQMQSKNGKTTARIQLEPPAIGRLNIHMQMNNDIIKVRLIPESEDAKRLLMGDADRLKSALEIQGIRVEKMEFSTPGETRDPTSQFSHGQNTGGNESLGRDGHAHQPSSGSSNETERSDQASTPEREHESEDDSTDSSSMMLDVRV